MAVWIQGRGFVIEPGMYLFGTLDKESTVFIVL